MSLTTRAAVKQWLGIATTVTTYDALLDRLILAVDEEIGRYCDRDDPLYSFDSGTYTELFDGMRADRVLLHNTPIASVTSVTLTDGTNETEIESTLYTFEPKTGILAFRDSVSFRWEAGYEYPISPHATRFVQPGFPAGFRNVEVVYVGGYATIPYSLEQIAIEQIGRRFRARSRDFTLKREKLGQYEYELADMSGLEVDDDLKDRLRSLGFASGALV